jgi:hypothetical protein
MSAGWKAHVVVRALLPMMVCRSVRSGAALLRDMGDEIDPEVSIDPERWIDPL